MLRYAACGKPPRARRNPGRRRARYFGLAPFLGTSTGGFRSIMDVARLLAATPVGLAVLFPDPVAKPRDPHGAAAHRAARDRPPSAVTLPGRDPRPEDEHIQALLGRPRTVHVDPEQYLPTLKTLRAGSNTRTLEPILIEGQRGVPVRKVLDSGSSIYGGPLDNLLVDQGVKENARILEDDPLSATAFTHSESTLARGAWKVRAVIATRIWSERLAPDQVVFRYERPAVRGEAVEGRISRRWVWTRLFVRGHRSSQWSTAAERCP
jgi:hypothetical protein